MYTASQNVIEYCKEFYSLNTKISEHWMYSENMIQIEKSLLNGKMCMCRSYIEKLSTINFMQALLQ